LIAFKLSSAVFSISLNLSSIQTSNFRYVIASGSQ
jgi:hypothetical protein